MAFPIISGLPSPTLTGLPNQGHLRWAPNQGAWWVFYPTGTNLLSALYSTNDGSSWSAPAAAATDGTTISGSSFQLTAAHNSEGRNFGFALGSLGGHDVLHLNSAYETGSTSASVYHSRITLGTTWTHTNAEAQVGSTTNPGLTYAAGGACGIDSAGVPYDANGYLGGGGGQTVAEVGANADSGTSWTAGFGNATTFAGRNWWTASNALLSTGSGTMMLIADGATTNVGTTSTGYNNIVASQWSGTAWGGLGNVFTSNLTNPTLPLNWCACARTTSDIHLITLADNASNFSTVRFNGTSWQTGDPVPALSSSIGANAGISIVTDGTNAWAATIDNLKNICAIKWTSGTGWTNLSGVAGSWSILEATRSNTPSYITGAVAGTGKVMWAWVESNAGQFNIVGSGIGLSPGVAPTRHFLALLGCGS